MPAMTFAAAGRLVRRLRPKIGHVPSACGESCALLRRGVQMNYVRPDHCSNEMLPQQTKVRPRC